MSALPPKADMGDVKVPNRHTLRRLRAAGETVGPLRGGNVYYICERQKQALHVPRYDRRERVNFYCASIDLTVLPLASVVQI
jgi:hypothetical protein